MIRCTTTSLIKQTFIRFAGERVGQMPIYNDGCGKVRVAVPYGPPVGMDIEDRAYHEIYMRDVTALSGEPEVELESVLDFERLFDHSDFRPIQS
ncbi:hypothetical protein [Magnetospirillum molischianum]|uniref:Uncharacterized protein n=1 Tax=Magnetospirillum molischianum DSM 120 TaxID=1150626 RepID=H8FY26_MAGML|nr:hypothetical protein [Magnetospirillum molischianum]CCG43264.1 hypothetical protein PHAMO_80055 [Magnetospirillum molischianum DSM 120]